MKKWLHVKLCVSKKKKRYEHPFYKLSAETKTVFNQTNIQDKDKSKYKWQLFWHKSKSVHKSSHIQQTCVQDQSLVPQPYWNIFRIEDIVTYS